MLTRLVASAAKRVSSTAIALRRIHVSAVVNAIEVKMPSLSPTMTEGTIVKWNKNEGDAVSAGDVVCEIQTDKAVVSLEVDDDGTLAKIFKPADSGTIKVGTLIAMLAEDGEDWKEVQTKGAPSDSEVSVEAKEEVEQVIVPTGGSTPGIEVKMPSLSPTMTEGTIIKWCKIEGDPISAGDVLCEIQTDKAVVSMEWDDDGILAKILIPEGSTGIQVNSLIALTVNEGEDWKDVQIPGSTQESKMPTKKVKKGPSGGNTPGTEIKMPSLSPTMTEGTIVKWCKSEGETISAGDVLCEVQTDKAVVSMEVDDDAILAKILVPEGDAGIQVGTLIALTVEEGQDWKDVQIPAEEDASEELVSEEAAPVKVASKEVSEAHVVPIARAGPAVMLLCAQYGIDPSNVISTGPRGLIKSDVLKYIKDNNLTPLKIASKPATPKQVETKVQDTTPQHTTTLQRPRSGYTDIPLTSMRAVIAKRLSESKSTSPHGYSTAECNINGLNAIRNDFKASGIKVSLNDLVIKAAATALQLVPEVNLNTVGEDDYQLMPNIDISVAVATPNGLITPIVTDVVGKSLPQISDTVRDLALRARDGKLQLNEFQGGTFTISNLGMYGIKEFTAIINPPQGAIMAVGSGTVEIDADSGKPYQAMRATLSFDRRFIDENTANIFMATFQRIVEQPQYMNIGLIPTARRVNAMEL